MGAQAGVPVLPGIGWVADGNVETEVCAGWRQAPPLPGNGRRKTKAALAFAGAAWVSESSETRVLVRIVRGNG